MATPYIGEIRVVGFNFAPQGWYLCQGQIIAIAENQALFSLIGTTYGGDGMSTFGLPDLRGRSPVHRGTGGGATYSPGQTGGSETVTLTAAQIPAHTHPINAVSGNGGATSPAGQTFAGSALGQYDTADGQASGPILAQNTGGQPHSNLMPYLTVNFIIAGVGVYPSQN